MWEPEPVQCIVCLQWATMQHWARVQHSFELLRMPCQRETNVPSDACQVGLVHGLQCSVARPRHLLRDRGLGGVSSASTSWCARTVSPTVHCSPKLLKTKRRGTRKRPLDSSSRQRKRPRLSDLKTTRTVESLILTCRINGCRRDGDDGCRNVGHETGSAQSEQSSSHQHQKKKLRKHKLKGPRRNKRTTGAEDTQSQH